MENADERYKEPIDLDLTPRRGTRQVQNFRHHHHSTSFAALHCTYLAAVFHFTSHASHTTSRAPPMCEAPRHSVSHCSGRRSPVAHHSCTPIRASCFLNYAIDSKDRPTNEWMSHPLSWRFRYRYSGPTAIDSSPVVLLRHRLIF